MFALLVLMFALGASLASFGCVVAERVPRGEPITGRSHCVCRRPLRTHENLPVIGWLAGAGKSRCCQVRIPVRYVTAEALLGAATATATVPLLHAMAGYRPVAGPLAGLVFTVVVGFGIVVSSCWRRPENPD